MAHSLGVNLRVTAHCNPGGRKYMEDIFSVAYQQTDDEKDLEYAFFGIFDGHGGHEAAQFAKVSIAFFSFFDLMFVCFPRLLSSITVWVQINGITLPP